MGREKSLEIAGANFTPRSGFAGLLPGNYLVTPMLTGYAFNPFNSPVTITGANSTSNNFVSAVTLNPRPVVGTFFDPSTVNLPPATRDLFDGTKILLKHTILLPDNCPKSFTIANVGTLQSTLDYVVADDGGLGGFLDFTNGVGSMQIGNNSVVSVTVDPRFVTGEPTLVGATLGLSIYTPQASNVIKSFVSFDIRSTDDALIGTWSGTWSGVGYGGSVQGSNSDPTVPINGNWVMQIDSVDFSTGNLGGTLTWTGTDAVWSNDGLMPTLVSVNTTTTFTTANTLPGMLQRHGRKRSATRLIGS